MGEFINPQQIQSLLARIHKAISAVKSASEQCKRAQKKVEQAERQAQQMQSQSNNPYYSEAGDSHRDDNKQKAQAELAKAKEKLQNEKNALTGVIHEARHHLNALNNAINASKSDEQMLSSLSKDNIAKDQAKRARAARNTDKIKLTRWKDDIQKKLNEAQKQLQQAEKAAFSTLGNVSSSAATLHQSGIVSRVSPDNNINSETNIGENLENIIKSDASRVTDNYVNKGKSKYTQDDFWDQFYQYNRMKEQFKPAQVADIFKYQSTYTGGYKKYDW